MPALGSNTVRQKRVERLIGEDVIRERERARHKWRYRGTIDSKHGLPVVVRSHTARLLVAQATDDDRCRNQYHDSYRDSYRKQRAGDDFVSPPTDHGCDASF